MLLTGQQMKKERFNLNGLQNNMNPLVITTVAIIIIFVFVLCIYQIKEQKSFFQEVEKLKQYQNKINSILENCKEDSIVIDGVKYIKVPRPTHFWIREE